MLMERFSVLTIYALFIFFSAIYLYLHKHDKVMLKVYLSMIPTFILIHLLIHHHHYQPQAGFYELSQFTILSFCVTLFLWAAYLVKKTR